MPSHLRRACPGGPPGVGGDPRPPPSQAISHQSSPTFLLTHGNTSSLNLLPTHLTSKVGGDGLINQGGSSVCSPLQPDRHAGREHAAGAAAACAHHGKEGENSQQRSFQ